MAELIVKVEDLNFVGTELHAELLYRHRLQTQWQRHTLTPANAGVTSANALSGLKTLLIALALSRYGVTIVATDILVLGAPQ